MIKNYTNSQLKVWNSVVNVSKKISNITNFFMEEDLKSIGDSLRNTAQKLQTQLEEEIKEEEYDHTFTGYKKSLNLVNMMEEDLIFAFDQGCITERELKVTLEAITIYTQEIKSHLNQSTQNHKLLKHLNAIPEHRIMG